jgi:host factor-I protein
VNGIKLQGPVDCFGKGVGVLKNNVRPMGYNHAISPIGPARKLKMPIDEE